VSVFRHFLFGLLLSGFAAHGVAADTKLFRYEGRTYSADQASPKLRTLLYDLDLQYYEQRQALADELLFELYVASEAGKRGVGTAALTEELLDIQPAREDELRAFYNANAARINQPYEQVRERIRQLLHQQRLRSAKAKLLADVKDARDFELLLAAPEAPPVEIATEGFPRKGAKVPRFTIVEFGDYQCPYCQKAARVLRRVIERNPDDVQLIYMDFPINRSGISRLVAQGATCAQKQGQFWAYHDLAYKSQSQLTSESPTQLAKALELDEAAFAECLAGRGAKARVARSEAEARRLGLSATPSIFVNGRPLRSRHLERDLQRLIDAASSPDQG
jgi:2-hydroxychromene-2-carboxylate isomerase